VFAATENEETPNMNEKRNPLKSTEMLLENLKPKVIEKAEYIKLWQYFSDRADMLKEKLWTISTWLLVLASGIIGFTLKEEFIVLGPELSAPAPWSAFVLSLIGMLICAFGFLVILDYGEHIRGNWDRANRLKEKIVPLHEIITGKGRDTDEDEQPDEDEWADEEEPSAEQQWLIDLPKFCIHLLMIVGFFSLGFVGMLILAVVELVVL
jgi:hypothetical protein